MDGPLNQACILQFAQNKDSILDVQHFCALPKSLTTIKFNIKTYNCIVAWHVVYTTVYFRDTSLHHM
jgi:hypothetical protein